MGTNKVCLMQAHSSMRLVGCVEVLQPSQPNGPVMSSAVSLPNHMFTGLA